MKWWLLPMALISSATGNPSPPEPISCKRALGIESIWQTSQTPTRAPLKPFKVNSLKATAAYLASPEFKRAVRSASDEDMDAFFNDIVNDKELPDKESEGAIRLTHFLLHLDEQLERLIPSEIERTEWLFGHLGGNDDVRPELFAGYQRTLITHAILEGWLSRKEDWSSREQATLSSWLIGLPGGLAYEPFEMGSDELNLALGDQQFYVWNHGLKRRIAGWSEARLTAVFAAWGTLVLRGDYSASEFIEGVTTLRTLRPEVGARIQEDLKAQIEPASLADIYRTRKFRSPLEFRRFVLAVRLGWSPLPKDDLALTKYVLFKSRSRSLRGTFWNELWKMLMAADPLWVTTYLLLPLEQRHGLETRDQRPLSQRLKQIRSASGVLNEAAGYRSNDIDDFRGGDDPSDRANLIFEFLESVDRIARRLDASTLARLRSWRGIEQVEYLSSQLERAIPPADDRNRERYPRYLRQMVAMFTPMSRSAVQQMRGEAVDLVEAVAGSDRLHRLIEPLRVQVHNQPDLTLLEDLKVWRSVLAQTAPTQRFSQAERDRALQLSEALIASVSRFLDIVRSPIEVGPTEFAHDPLLAAQKLTTRLESLSAKTRGQATGSFERQQRLAEEQLYGLFLHLDLTSIVDFGQRLAWVDVLLRNLVAADFIEDQALKIARRYSWRTLDPATLGQFLVQLEERVLARVEKKLEPAQQIRESLLEELIRSTPLRALSKVVAAFGDWQMATLTIRDEHFRVVVLSPGRVTARVAKNHVEYRTEVPEEPTLFEALVLERLPSLSHHVVMKMRALKRPIVVARENNPQLRKLFAEFADQAVTINATAAEVSIATADQIPIPKDFLKSPSARAQNLGPKGRMLRRLSRNPYLAERIAPFLALPKQVIAEPNLVAPWINRLRQAYPTETKWHFRSDFDAEDGREFNASGLFESVSFVSPYSDLGKTARQAIDRVVVSWQSAPLAQIFGVHLRERGHRPKILLSASRPAVISGVALITPRHTRVEVHTGSEGVVSGHHQAERWDFASDGKATLISLQERRAEIGLRASMRRQMRRVISEVNRTLPPNADGWEMEFGIDDKTVWIHQLRQAF